MEGVTRHGKFLDIEVGGLHLILHLARAGWIRWRDEVPAMPPRPGGKSPLAARIVLDNGAGLDITEAGTEEVARPVRRPVTAGRPGHRPARSRPACPTTSPSRSLQEILTAAGRAQLKGVLRYQSTIAGIGNAYSDEILHAARMSPSNPRHR